MSMNSELPTMNGDLVILRPIDKRLDHFAWFDVEQDEKIHTWVGNHVPTSIEEVEYNLYELYPEYFMIWMIVAKKTGRVIGMMRISHPEQEGNLLVAGDSQRLHSDYWRKGYMKESRQYIYNYIFNECKVDVLYADVWKGNINSSKSLEASGYQLVAVKQEFFKKYNRWQNKLYYELTAERWNNRGTL